MCFTRVALALLALLRVLARADCVLRSLRGRRFTTEVTQQRVCEALVVALRPTIAALRVRQYRLRRAALSASAVTAWSARTAASLDSSVEREAMLKRRARRVPAPATSKELSDPTSLQIAHSNPTPKCRRAPPNAGSFSTPSTPCTGGIARRTRARAHRQQPHKPPAAGQPPTKTNGPGQL